MWRATARALAELGCAAFFIGGMAWTALGVAAPWAVLAVVLLSVVVRAADLEARALFVRGGLYGSVRETLGQRPATVAASALLVDRLMLGALAAVVAGHYLVAFGRSVVGVTTPSLAGDSGPMTFALAAIGVVWWLQRQGRSPRERTVAQAVGGVGRRARSSWLSARDLRRCSRRSRRFPSACRRSRPLAWRPRLGSCWRRSAASSR